jgi:site-specific recombinase XerC
VSECSKRNTVLIFMMTYLRRDGLGLSLYLLIASRIAALSKLQPDAIAVMYATALERGGQRGEGLAPSSVKMIHRLLVQAFRQAVKWQLIARNPVDAVSAPRVERRQMRVLDTDGAAAYLAASRGRELFVPIHAGHLVRLAARRDCSTALARR